MSARTVVNVVVALALLATIYWIVAHNQPVLSQELELPFRIPGHAEAERIPVEVALFASFIIGALCVFVSWTFRGIQAEYERWLARFAGRASSEAEALYHRALQAMVNGRQDRALQLMRDALQKKPDHAGALMTGADVLRALGRAAEAVEWRLRRLEGGEDILALHGLAEDYWAQGNLKAAAATFERVLAAEPKRSLAAAERLREVFIEMENWEKALAAHDRLQKMATHEGVAADPEADLVRAGLEVRWATQLADADKEKDAIALLKKVIRRHPDYVPAYLAAAEVHDLAGRDAEALQTWVDGYERTNEAAILVAAEDHFVERLREGDPMETATAALSAFKRFAACSGRRPQAVAFLGKLYTRFEMLDEAAAAFDSIRAEFPDNPTFTYYAGRIAEKQGRHAQAAALFRAIIKSLDVLRLRYRCEACGTEAGAYVDRCPGCRRWGRLGLDIGVQALRDALPAPRPVYAVPDSEDGAVEHDGLA